MVEKVRRKEVHGEELRQDYLDYEEAMEKEEVRDNPDLYIPREWEERIFMEDMRHWSLASDARTFTKIFAATMLKYGLVVVYDA